MWVECLSSTYTPHIQGEKANKRRHQVCKINQRYANARTHSLTTGFPMSFEGSVVGNGYCQPCNTTLPLIAHLFVHLCRLLGDLMGSYGILGHPFAHDPISVLSALSARLSKSQGSPHISAALHHSDQHPKSYKNWLGGDFFSRSVIQYVVLVLTRHCFVFLGFLA